MAASLFSFKTRAPAECVVRVGAAGEEISDLYPFLVDVTVETSRTAAATATLVFETRRDEHGKWIVQDAGVLVEWEPIVIEAAFGPDTEEIMRGYIRQVIVEYPESQGNATVKVECQDDSLRLDRSTRRFVWGADTPTSDALVLSTILQDYPPLTPAPDNGAGQDALQVSQDDTDIQFLRKRAEENGYELIFSRGEVYFGPMRLTGAARQGTIMVYAGADTNCLGFSANADAHQADAVAVDVPDAEGDGQTEQIVRPNLALLGTVHADSASSGLGDFVWKMSGAAGADETTLVAKAQQKANDFDIHKVKAEGELDGTLYGHVLQVGLLVPVDGVGERFGGTYYVDKVSHHINQGGYRQRFTLLRNGFGDDLGASAPSAIAGVI